MPRPLLDHRNVNVLACSVLAQTLRHLGLEHAVICPGSRSAPLVFGFTGCGGIECSPVLDERSAAYFATGIARRAGKPVALVCTSGTAAANFLPAVIEAREAGIPLLVLTADRPPELRHCGANQAIDQVKLYGSFPVWQAECALPEASEALLRALRQTAVHAWERAQLPAPGPVHLNLPFRDPLPPLDDGLARALEGRMDERAFFAGLGGCGATPATTGTAAPWRAPARGLIIIGTVQTSGGGGFAREVAAAAARLGWPVLADALNPLRSRADLLPGLVTCYDPILRNAEAAARLAPEQVLAIGDWPTSRVLRGWLEELQPQVWMCGAGMDDADPLHCRTRHWRGSPAALAAAAEPAAPDAAWCASWLGAETRARAALSAALDSTPAGFEGRIPGALAGALPAGTAVFLGNSLPVRDAEYFWPAGGAALHVWCNRGASGIDGVLSSAVGVAHGGPPAVLVTGELSFLHDGSGLLLARELRGHLTVLVINNGGGGIFNMLPVSDFDPPFERFFATPQQADIALLAQAHGIPHATVPDIPALRAALSDLSRPGIRILEWRSDRVRGAAVRRELLGNLKI